MAVGSAGSVWRTCQSGFVTTCAGAAAPPSLVVSLYNQSQLLVYNINNVTFLSFGQHVMLGVKWLSAVELFNAIELMTVIAIEGCS